MAPSNYSFEATDLVASFFTYIALFFVACLVAKSRISMAFADVLAPLFMGLILGAMTLLLARLEFRNFPRKR